MTKHKSKGYRKIGAIDEAFKYENTRRDFKCCSQQEKLKTICQTTAISTVYQEPKGTFSDKVVPDDDGVNDELM